LRTRNLSGFDLAEVLIDTVYEPLRRWGSKTGIVCVWGLCVDGRKVLLTLLTAPSERDDSCLEVLRDRVKRGLQTPVTITTEGAPGVIEAIEAMWPRSLRMRCWLHKRPNLHEKVPP
jgi:transposase-like protein